MVLADTSVWVDHLRNGNRELQKLLNEEEAICHPFVIGELACGNLRNRKEILSLLQSLTSLDIVDHYELLSFIDGAKLMGKGLGLVDMHLLAVAQLHGVPLWTLDKKLQVQASRLGLGN